MTTDFEQAAKAALARELVLMQDQAARRARDRATAAADPARKVDRQRFLAGLYGRKGPDPVVQRNLSATRRSSLDGSETRYSRDPWDLR
jgi:hypothetical protein